MNPIKEIGSTPTGQAVLAGAFQMSDTEGFPLSSFMVEASSRNYATSIPHYFASAMEHGWDDIQTFGKIREAMVDAGSVSDFESVKERCIFMFMRVAENMPGQPATEIGKKMREELEAK